MITNYSKFFAFFFLLVSPLLVLGQSPVYDMMPLHVGNTYTYQYYYSYTDNDMGYMLESDLDSGVVTLQIISNAINDSSIIWQVLEIDSLHSKGFSIFKNAGGYYDTFKVSQYTFDISEALTDSHKIGVNNNSLVWDFSAGLSSLFRYTQSGSRVCYSTKDDTTNGIGMSDSSIFAQDTGFCKRQYRFRRGLMELFIYRISITLSRFNNITAIEKQSPFLARESNLTLKNFPNPFNSSTIISYSIPTAGNVKIDLYDIMGSKIATLENRWCDAGNNTFRFDTGKQAINLATGIYIICLKAGGQMISKKINYLK